MELGVEIIALSLGPERKKFRVTRRVAGHGLGL